ncbi:unnamed protein product, partial [Phaeothamnion confervicola]
QLTACLSHWYRFPSGHLPSIGGRSLLLLTARSTGSISPSQSAPSTPSSTADSPQTTHKNRYRSRSRRVRRRPRPRLLRALLGRKVGASSGSVGCIRRPERSPRLGISEWQRRAGDHPQVDTRVHGGDMGQ